MNCFRRNENHELSKAVTFDLQMKHEIYNIHAHKKKYHGTLAMYHVAFSYG